MPSPPTGGRSRRHLPSNLLAAALALLAMSGIFAAGFALHFRLGRWVPVLHVVVVAAVLALAVLLLAVVVRLVHSRAVAELLVAATLATGLLLLFLVYAANFTSNLLWGQNVSWDLFSYYWLRMQGLDALPFPVGWALTAGAVLLAAAIVPPWLLRHRFVRDLESIGATSQRRRTLAVGTLVLLALGTLATVTVAAAGIRTASWTDDHPSLAAFHRRQLLRREPLLGLWTNSGATGSGIDFLVSRQLATNEPAVRRSYPRAVDTDARPNVVLIVVDSLRPDHMQVYGYDRPTTPYLSSLAEAGHLVGVQRAFASCPESACGITSLLSSRVFASETRENFKLHELLFDQGYAVHLVLSGDHSWYGLREFYGDAFTSLRDGRDAGPRTATDDRLVLDRLDQLPPFRGEPTFFYLHLMSAHQAATRLDPYRRWLPAPRDAWLRDHAGREREFRRNHYDNGVLQADAMIEGALERLDRGGYLSDAVVMIVSDHGEGLGEQGRWGHSSALTPAALAIPWLILDPDLSRYRNLDLALQVDVAATVVDRLGLPQPSSWKGRSLLEPPTPRTGYLRTGTEDASYGLLHHTAEGSLYQYLEYSDSALRTLAHRGWRSGAELYDLTADPGATTNLLDTADDRLLDRLAGALRQRQRDLLSDRDAESPDGGHE